MGRIPRDLVEAVRERTDLVELVTRHVKLQRKGNSYVGLCPFHQEKTPSFNVIPSKNFFHCYGCQKSGDCFGFLMDMEGLSFAEAVKELAGPAGVTIEERELSPMERRRQREQASLYDVLEAAANFYEARLWTDADGESVRAYLTDRGLSPEVCKAARLGFAPEGWTPLLDALQRDGFRPNQLQEAGLASPTKRGGLCDFFRARLMIPIRDHRGRVISFGGRILPGATDGAKYMNGRDTALYTKKSILYGLDVAGRAINRRDRAVLVEGYFDVISLHAAGFEEAIATCGTSLTPDHVRKLRTKTRNIIVLTDADEAGSKAAEKMLPMLVEAGIQAWRIQLPDAKDPDELIREHGPEAMDQALEARKPLFDWVVQRKRAQHGYDSAGTERVLAEVVETLGKVSPAQISAIAGALNLREDLVLERVRREQSKQRAAPSMQRFDGPPDGPAQAEGPAVPRWRPHRDVSHLLWLLVHRYDQVADLAAQVDGTRLLAQHAPALPAVARLVQGEPFATVLEEEPHPDVRRTLAAVATKQDLYGAEVSARAFVEVMLRFAKPLRERRQHQLLRELEEAAQQGDQDALMSAHRERTQLLREAQQADQALKDAARLTASRPRHLTPERAQALDVEVQQHLLVAVAVLRPPPPAEAPHPVPEPSAAEPD